MIHTVYSNSYEILRTFLIHTLGENTSENPFEPIRVISGSRIINSELMLDIAKEQNICAGIDFWTLENWFHNYVGFGLGSGASSQEFLWTLWRLLDDDFIGEHPRLKQYFFESNRAIDPALLRYDFAKSLATVFYKYVNYRFDWVIRWMYPELETQTVSVLDKAHQTSRDREQKALEAHPDFVWQKALWERLGKTEHWIGAQTLKLFARWSSIEQKIAKEPRELHFFAPLSVSPLMLPIMKLLSEDPKHSVHVYILNPSQTYWFGSTDDSATPVSHFLRKNAAATRALINRFNYFANDEGEPQPDAYKPVVRPAVDILARESLQRLQLSTDALVDRIDLHPNDGSLLHRIQNAILTDNTQEFPEAIDASDRSLRFVKAPTATREVENIAAIIQALMHDKSLPGLKPDDILVVTPDIEAAAPIIDATMSTLPAEARIDYRIVGRSGVDEAMTGQALLQLGKLLMSPFGLDELENWLELPIVTQSLGLALDDLNVLRDWLVAAGFRSGLNSDQLVKAYAIAPIVNGQEHEALEGTLERALERLSWGLVLENKTTSAVADIIPVSKGPSLRFESVTANEELLKTLLWVEANLRLAYEELQNLGDTPTLHAMAGWANRLVETFFAQKAQASDIIALQGAIRAIDPQNAPDEETLVNRDDDICVPPSLFWAALTDIVAEPAAHASVSGCVTFASLAALRHIPHRVIIAFGMNENSSFPGTEHFEEFDLMGETRLKRQDDRDSRSDNRNLFLNLLLCARDRLICSWCVGSDKKNPKNPSAVITDLAYFMTANLPEENREDARQAFLKAITTRIALSPASPTNYQTDATRYWGSFNRDTALAIDAARATHYQAKEPRMAIGPVRTELFDGRLTIESVIDFYKRPSTWILKTLRVRHFDESATQTVPLLPEMSPLNCAILKSRFIEQFDAGLTTEDVQETLKVDPLMGAVNAREIWAHDMLEETHALWQIYEAQKAHYDNVEILDRERPIEGLPSLTSLSIKELTLWKSKEGEEPAKLYYPELITSNSAFYRAHLKALFIQWVLDEPVGLIVVMKQTIKGEKGKEEVLQARRFEAAGAQFTQRIVSMVLELIQYTLKNLTVALNQYEEPGVLWRGLDDEAALDRTQQWQKSLEVVLDKLLNDDNFYQKDEFTNLMETFKKLITAEAA